ncbi:hypothetical protein GGQ80_003220 [Sphingomonas jinjuensis]|uniref:Uncharacterized protein n=1 Tax=Sphingomonas jinjuensis TaxID=535907 RepID=A0A840FBA1_9SPHN|nr:hypothetical protein [Sphingomonas jinjuensis]MBB4155300.1 hypothetical protein [Sphingomonas jinjuensis]
MKRQPNKPGGGYLASGQPRPVADLQAVQNQAVVSPDDYPDSAGVPHDLAVETGIADDPAVVTPSVDQKTNA